MNDKTRNRLRFIGVVIALLAVILLSKLYFVQIVEAKFFKDRADHQHVALGASIFDRGSVSFTDKSGNLVNAASLKEGYILAVNPYLVKDAEGIYKSINDIYPIPHDEFITKATKQSDPYEVIVPELPQEQGDSIDALKLPGVVLSKARWRFYPGEKLASQVLGFVGYDGNTLTGRYGLEKYYNDVLSRDSSDAYTNFFSQIFSNIGQTIQSQKLGGEGDLTLTIEPSVESFLTDEITKVKEEYKSGETGAVIINPQNGEIYAMAALPDFNPNSFEKETDQKVFIDPIVQNVYEMGSIIKPLTMAAGLDSGAVTAQTTYDDKGFLILNGKKIQNYDGKGRGVIPMQEVLNQSLNTGASFVALKMGDQKFGDYMRNYGLGEETGIDLPGEVHGLLNNLKSPRDVDYATASFGQGIALTPIETVRALSALGNGGKLITPHVVREIHYTYGLTKKLSYGDGVQILKPETSHEISRMLVGVVDNALAHGKAKNEHYTVAAKTGTAQIANPNGGGYYADHYLHSFFGYFPAYNPQFLVFFFTVNPQGVQFASETLTQPFLETSKFLINYYNVPPDR